jgi:hypothetical protein
MAALAVAGRTFQIVAIRKAIECHAVPPVLIRRGVPSARLAEVVQNAVLRE